MAVTHSTTEASALITLLFWALAFLAGIGFALVRHARKIYALGRSIATLKERNRCSDVFLEALHQDGLSPEATLVLCRIYRGISSPEDQVDPSTPVESPLPDNVILLHRLDS